MSEKQVILSQEKSTGIKKFDVSGEIIVPDIKPDIVTIIATNANVYVYKQEITNGKIKVGGNIDTYIIYISDSGDTRSIQTTLDFTEVLEDENAIEQSKLITNIKLENAQANFGFSGNPETDSLKGVSDLDNTKNGGSKYLRAELEENNISGANLELTYGISVINTSDVNYYNNEYYWYGEANPNKEVTLSIDEITDYLDSALEYKADNSDKRIEISSDVNIEGKTVFKLGNIGVLYTENNPARKTDGLKTSDTFALVARKYGLSEGDVDMEYLNQAKITKINKGTDPRDTDNGDKDEEIKEPEEPNTSEARATIIPPTGADRQTIIIYTITGIIALAILSAGVIMIKKIVKK